MKTARLTLLLAALLGLCAIRCNAATASDDPTINIRLDIQSQDDPFEVPTHQYDTPIVRAYLFNDGDDWFPSTNDTWKFGIGTNEEESVSLFVATGTVSTATNYVDFPLTAGDTAIRGSLFSQVICIRSTGKQYTWKDGRTIIDKNPLGGTHSTNAMTSTVNWDTITSTGTLPWGTNDLQFATFTEGTTNFVHWTNNNLAVSFKTNYAGSSYSTNQIDTLLNNQSNNIVSTYEAEDLTFLKIDGSRAMTSNLNHGTFPATNASGYYGDGTTLHIHADQDAAEGIYIDTGGSVGIGTNGPLSVLEIAPANVVYVALTNDIETVVAAAEAGDCLMLAAGTYTITDDIDITESISLIGAGKGLTKIMSITDSKNYIHITASTCTVRNITLDITSSGGTGILVDGSAGTVLTGVIIENVDVLHNTHLGAQTGMRFLDASGEIRDCKVKVTGSTAAYGVIHENQSTAEAATHLYCFGTRIDAQAGANTYGVRSYDNSASNDNTLHMYNCTVYGTTDGALASNGDAYLYAENCIFEGGSSDVVNSAGTLRLRDCTLVTDTSTGTVAYDGEVVADKLFAKSNIGVGMAPVVELHVADTNGSAYVRVQTTNNAANDAGLDLVVHGEHWRWYVDGSDSGKMKLTNMKTGSTLWSISTNGVLNLGGAIFTNADISFFMTFSNLMDSVAWDGESDPYWAAVSNTITTKADNGNTAYAWGDHADAGYLTTGSNTFSEIVVGNSGNVSTNLTVNGTFTGSEAGWNLTNATYSANQIYCPIGQLSTITPSNAVDVVRNKLYKVEAKRTTSDSSETIIITMGGVTNTWSSGASGYFSAVFPVKTTAGLMMRVTPSSDSVYIDDVTVKEVLSGDASVHRLYVSDEIYIDGTNIASYVQTNAFSLNDVCSEGSTTAVPVLLTGGLAVQSGAAITGGMTYAGDIVASGDIEWYGQSTTNELLMHVGPSTGTNGPFFGLYGVSGTNSGTRGDAVLKAAQTAGQSIVRAGTNDWIVVSSNGVVINGAAGETPSSMLDVKGSFQFSGALGATANFGGQALTNAESVNVGAVTITNKLTVAGGIDAVGGSLTNFGTEFEAADAVSIHGHDVSSGDGKATTIRGGHTTDTGSGDWGGDMNVESGSGGAIGRSGDINLTVPADEKTGNINIKVGLGSSGFGSITQMVRSATGGGSGYVSLGVDTPFLSMYKSGVSMQYKHMLVYGDLEFQGSAVATGGTYHGTHYGDYYGNLANGTNLPASGLRVTNTHSQLRFLLSSDGTTFHWADISNYVAVTRLDVLSNQVVVLEGYTTRVATAYGWGDHGTNTYTTNASLNVVSNLVVTLQGYTSRVATAYGWGDHSTNGYGSATDITALQGYTNRAAAAYLWGDHSTNDYATLAALALVSNLVDTLEGYTNYAATAYGWGDHGTNGYVTNASLNVVSSQVAAVEGYTNWAKTAYDWGDHGTNDYSTLADLALVSNLVDDVEGYTNWAAVAYGWGDHGTNTYTTNASLNVVSNLVDILESYTTRVVTAYAWGSHLTNGYVTNASLTIVSNLVDDVEDYTNRTRIAYGWGDHADAGYLTASTSVFDRVTIADSGQLGGELTTNGTFTGSAAGWALTNATYGANRIHIAFGNTGTINPSNALACVTGRIYKVAFDRVTSDSDESITVSLGGQTNVWGSGASASLYVELLAKTTEGLVMTVEAVTDSVYIDNLSVKQYTAGDLWAAGEVWAQDVYIQAVPVTSFVSKAIGTATNTLDASKLLTGTAPADIYGQLSNCVWVSQQWGSNGWNGHSPLSAKAKPQEAFTAITDAATANRYSIMVLPGLYNQGTITGENFVAMCGVGARGSISFTNDTTPLMTFPSGGNSGIQNMRFKSRFVNADSSMFVVTNGGTRSIRDCAFVFDTTNYGHIAALTNGTLDFYNCKFEYTEVGSDLEINTNCLFRISGAGNVFFSGCEFEVNGTDTNDHYYIIGKCGNSAVETVLRDSRAEVTISTNNYSGRAAVVLNRSAESQTRIENVHSHLTYTGTNCLGTGTVSHAAAGCTNRISGGSQIVFGFFRNYIGTADTGGRTIAHEFDASADDGFLGTVDFAGSTADGVESVYALALGPDRVLKSIWPGAIRTGTQSSTSRVDFGVSSHLSGGTPGYNDLVNFSAGGKVSGLTDQFGVDTLADLKIETAFRSASIGGYTNGTLYINNTLIDGFEGNKSSVSTFTVTNLDSSVTYTFRMFASHENTGGAGYSAPQYSQFSCNGSTQTIQFITNLTGQAEWTTNGATYYTFGCGPTNNAYSWLTAFEMAYIAAPESILADGTVPMGADLNHGGYAGTNINFLQATNYVVVGTNAPTSGVDLEVDGKMRVAGQTYPGTNGAAGEVLRTDGSGTLGWGYPNGNGITNSKSCWAGQIDSPTNGQVVWGPTAYRPWLLTNVVTCCESGSAWGNIIYKATNQAWGVYATNMVSVQFAISVDKINHTWVDATLSQWQKLGLKITNAAAGKINWNVNFND